MTGPSLGDPIWSGRFWVGHKPDPDRFVDRPNITYVVRVDTY